MKDQLDSIVAAGAEPATRAAMIEVLDLAIGPVHSKHLDGEVTEDQIDRIYREASHEVGAGPAVHSHLMEDLHASLAGRVVPSRRSAVSNARSALVQLAVATRLPEVVEDRIVVESYAALGILPTELSDALMADVDAHEASGAQSGLVAAIVPNGERMRSAIASASWSELSEAATLTMPWLAVCGWLTLLSLSNADDPTVVGMKAALGLPDAAFTSIRLGPREFVTQLSVLLSNPSALPWIAGKLEAIGEVLAADGGAEHLVLRQLDALRRLAGQ